MTIVVAPSARGLPTFEHWGGDLGELTSDDLRALTEVRRPGIPHSALDLPRSLAVVPDGASGFTGTPAVSGFRLAGGQQLSAWQPRWRAWTVTGDASASVVLSCADDEAGLAVDLTLELTQEVC